MPKEVLDETKERMKKTINVLKSELSSLRAGRANPKVLAPSSATFPRRSRGC